MNTASKGRRNEHRSRELLERAGYVVVRAAASKGTFDLVAIGPDDVLLVQTKSNRWPSAAELAEMAAFVAPQNCRRIIHRWRDRQRAPDVREV
jgi:hypothetical protein